MGWDGIVLGILKASWLLAATARLISDLWEFIV